jgi:hypothetical protein
MGLRSAPLALARWPADCAVGSCSSTAARERSSGDATNGTQSQNVEEPDERRAAQPRSLLSFDERGESAERGMGPYGDSETLNRQREVTKLKKPRAGGPWKRDTDRPSKPPKEI